jgi:NAD(P)H-dependent FMN reductase
MRSLQIIIGSTRTDRAADLVWPWIARRAAEHGAFQAEVLDLRDWQLPFFAESPRTLGDPASPAYSAPVVRQWNEKIAGGDAYVLVTPEYNHSVPAVLKNAMDSVYRSYALRNKPVAFVGYSAGMAGGARAISHLVDIACEAEMVPLRNVVLIPHVGAAFADGRPVSPAAEPGLRIMLDDLGWWADALAEARSKGELPPAPARMMAARKASAAPRDSENLPQPGPGRALVPPAANSLQPGLD